MPELTFPIQENSLSSGIRTHAYMHVRKYTHYLRDVHTISGIYFCLLRKNWQVTTIVGRKKRRATLSSRPRIVSTAIPTLESGNYHQTYS